MNRQPPVLVGADASAGERQALVLMPGVTEGAVPVDKSTCRQRSLLHARYWQYNVADNQRAIQFATHIVARRKPIELVAGVQMWYQQFEFKNFKGIRHLRVSLDGDVTTMIGLNESGKTTILEAISCFSYGAEDLSAIDPTLKSLRDPEQWIPISNRGNFNDVISIKAKVGLDESDRREFRQYMRRTFALNIIDAPESLEISENHYFKNSKRINRKYTWALELTATSGRQRKARLYGSKTKEWQGAVSFLKDRLPKIWYFPNFLFDLPERFDLEIDDNLEGVSDRAAFYKRTFDRVVKQLDGKADLETHVISRILSQEKTDKRNLDSILLDMGRKISSTVFDAWHRTLGTDPSGQEVVIQAGSDSKTGAYLELKIKGPNGYFDLSERSLGFRWFFLFLLMTSFHETAKETQKPLFLFDEPASNLHSSAQAELLKSFAALVERCHLVYSTHSHHMISLRWLNSSYVVSNSALGDLSFKNYVGNSITNTSISATKYRHFVSQNPSKISYVQPVLDLLDYRPSTFEPIPNVVMVEGRNDFFFLRYMIDVLGIEPDLHIVPGTGAGSLDTLIRLYSAWGKNYLVLLDSDREGSDQKRRYRELFGPLIDGKIIVLADAAEDELVVAPETLLNDEEKLQIVTALTPRKSERTVSKKELASAIVELYGRKQTVDLSEVSENRIRLLLTNLGMALGSSGS